MPKPIKFTSGSSQESIYQALCASDTNVQKTLARLLNSIPMPIDAPCLGFVCTAAKTMVEAAFALIPDLNMKGQSLLRDLTSLDDACKKVYSERGVVDAFDTMTGRKTLFTGWTTLAYFASNGLPTTSARLASGGMELALKLISSDRRLAAEAHMRLLGTGHLDFDISSAALVKGFHHENMGLSEVLPWFPRAKKNYFKLLAAFSDKPPPLPPPPSVHERAIALWTAHAAYPNFKQRAGVLDKTTASPLQIQKVTHPSFCSSFKSRPAFLTALWFSGFSGIRFDALCEIPLLGPECTYWAICLDLDMGLLKRDMSCLSTVSHPTNSEHCIAASMVSSTPIPEVVWKWLIEQRIAFPTANLLGDLIPELLLFNSTQTLCQSAQDIPLTWARWARTVGRVMVQKGIDNFKASVVSGNFGNTGRSKVHYAAVAPYEIWDTCKRIYLDLGFGEPVQMPSGLLHFGSSLVPAVEFVSACDLKNIESVEQVRKMGKCSIEELLKFHNRYVNALAFRLCCLLALREANPISITATIDIKEDDSIDIDDKSTPNRPGALPIPLTKCIKELINLYFAHCSAMKARLHGVRGMQKVTAWLNKIEAHADTHLLCKIDTKNFVVKALTTHEVISEHPELAKDFGRKVAENHMRLENISTRDLDRVMRHEILGQEAYSSVSDVSESAWLQRVIPALEALAIKLFPTKLYGLRSKA